MKDLVLQGIIDTFAEDRGMTTLPDSVVFEAFTATSILRKYHQADISDIEDDILVGGPQDGGIDAVGILVNGHAIRHEGDIDSLRSSLGRLDVEFVFVQAKTSPSFRGDEIGGFLAGVEQFFTPEPHIPLNDELLELADISKAIFRHSGNMRTNPRCHLYFVTSGIWEDPAEVRGRINQGVEHLDRLLLFSAVKFTPIGSDVLKTIYRELQHGVTKTVEISKTTTFPTISAVDEAYIGLIPGDQFIELVSTDQGDLNRDLFYDNVRDFQGHNPVNREIGRTLADDQLRQSFPLLNNGITIVARQLNRTGDTFTLSDFQIVNGCQTTHMLFQNRQSIDPSIFIPIKLVATSNSQVVTDVIKATNRQTEVRPEALESLSPFHRELEAFYTTRELTAEPNDRIYYERRSKQYSMDRINPSNIVTLTAQIKSFVAMFMNEPHSHPRYYGELLKAYDSRLFVHDHKPAPYYASGISLLTVEKLFNSSKLDRRFKKYKYHILMLLRMQIHGSHAPAFNNNNITQYSLDIVDALKDTERGSTRVSTGS